MQSITSILKSLQVSQDISQFDRYFSNIMRNFYIKLNLNKTCFISLMQTMFCFIISLSQCSTFQQPDALRKKDSKTFLICSFFSILKGSLYLLGACTQLCMLGVRDTIWSCLKQNLYVQGSIVEHLILFQNSDIS